MDLVRIDQEPVSQPEPDLRQHLNTMRRRGRVALTVFVGVTALGVVGSFLIKPQFKATAKLVVPSPAESRANHGEGMAAEIEQASAPRVVSLAAQADEMMSDQSIASALRAAGYPEKPRKAPTVKVDVPESSASDTMTVSVTWNTASGAAKLANTLAKAHVARIQERDDDALRRAVTYMRAEAARLRGEARTASRALQRAQEKYPVKQIAMLQEQRLREQSEKQSHLRQSRDSVASLQAQVRTYEEKLQREPRDLARPIRKDNPQRLLLQDKIRQLKIDRLQALKDFQPGSPEVQAIDDQLKDFNQQLAAEPRSITETTYAPNPRYETLETHLSQLEAELLASRESFRSAAAEGTAVAIPRDTSGGEARQAALAQESARAADRASQLEDRLQTLEVRLAAHTPSARVTQPAVPPPGPVAPMRALVMALSALLGLIGGVVAAFFTNYIDDRVYRPEDLEGPLRLPTLGCVPRLPFAETVVSEGRAPGALEAYRGVRTNISFAGLDMQLQRIQVTSPSSGEGKSLTALNLAITMALDGKSVILVDADLRSPSQHLLLGVDRTPGLSDVLGSDQRVDRALRATCVPNLLLLTAGSDCSNGAELLGSSNFRFILENLEGRADYIILDTAACTFSDPLVTASRVDGVILVVESAKTRKGDVQRALRLLRGAKARLLGVVYNRSNAEDASEVYAAWNYPGESHFQPATGHSQQESYDGFWSSAHADLGDDWPDLEVNEEWLEGGPGAARKAHRNGKNGAAHTLRGQRMLRAGRIRDSYEEDEDHLV